MSEKAIESSVCAWLAYQGYIPLKVGLEGWPDRCVILGSGRHVWMEFKTPEGKLRPQQVNRIVCSSHTIVIAVEEHWRHAAIERGEIQCAFMA